ncbi:uncharacterized protein [Palaemon carinicauda]|uniref:uncharacterized protein n=1 Tax=Palaemon carinicauda TaxID=392227 RepID=UPI0035B5D170
MFQRILILVAISAAFASRISPQISSCHSITYEVQRALNPDNPHTFPIISDINYIRDNISYTFDLPNLEFKGIIRTNCNDYEYLAEMIFEGDNLEFNTSDALIYINQPGFANPQITNFTSQLVNYTLEFRFEIDSYTSYPLNLCITRDSLQTNFSADGITTDVGGRLDVTNELNDHPDAVVEAINNLPSSLFEQPYHNTQQEDFAKTKEYDFAKTKEFPCPNDCDSYHYT